MNATQDVETGYFTQAMADCYEACQHDHGKSEPVHSVHTRY